MDIDNLIGYWPAIGNLAVSVDGTSVLKLAQTRRGGALYPPARAPQGPRTAKDDTAAAACGPDKSGPYISTQQA